ncbi:VPS10 domain-containing protein [Dyadobacter luticola]|nr:amidohydrolase family protein [Dyadobacter luticola]
MPKQSGKIRATDRGMFMIMYFKKICRTLLSGGVLAGVFAFPSISQVGQSRNDQQPHWEKISSRNPAGKDPWGYVGFGGGGAMFYPAVSPHNPNRAMVACDMTGSFATNDGGKSWQMFNLRGPVSYFVYDPADSNTVYANSIGLYKSTDQGSTWSLLYPSPADVSGIVSQGDHANEQLVTKDSTIRKVLAFAVDPADSKSLYAVISIDEKSAFYTSKNGGITWQKERELEGKTKNIYINPGSPLNDRTVYVCGQNSIMKREKGIWKTTINPGVEELTVFSGGFDKKSNQYIIYAISGTSYFNLKKEKSGIYYTKDGGETWENRQAGLTKFTVKGAAVPEWRTIATSALHPEVVYVSYANLKVHTDTTSIGVAKSEDFGLTWKLAWKDNLTSKGAVVSANFENDWVTERFGPGWGENPFSIGVSPSNPDICYATDFGRAIKSNNGGKSWEQVYTKKKDAGGWVSRGLEVTTSYAIVFDPFDKNHVFIANTDIGLMESRDGGEGWLSATQHNGVPDAWANSTYWLEFDPKVKGRIWAVMSGTHDLPRPKMWRKSGVKDYKGGVLLSEDAGKSWKPVSQDIGDGAMTHILIDPASDPGSRTLYVCVFGKGVYKSSDGGKSWQQKNKGIEGAEPFAWRILKREKDNHLFLIVNRRSEDGSLGAGDGALYRSTDGAESWTKVTLPAGTNAPTSLAVDPENAGKLILSAWGRRASGNFSPDTGGGIFISDNDGKSWKQVMENDQHIHDITYDPRVKTFYACGFNGAAYRSEDSGNSWSRLEGYDFKWGKRVEPDPQDPAKVYIVTFGGGIWHGPAKSEEKKQSLIHEINHKEIPAGKTAIAITGATIIDGNGGEPMQNGCVVVENGKITGVGKNGKIAIPAGAEIVDGKGMSLLPGFIDSHFHLDGENGLTSLFLQHGVTSLRDPGAWIEAYDGERKSGKPVPRLFLADPHLDMFPPAYPKDAYVVRDALEAVNQVNRMADRGASVIKVYFRLPPGIIEEVCKAAHKRGLPVTGHLETTEAMEAINAGLDGIEHITSFGLSLQPQIDGEKYRQMVLADNNARKKGRYDVWNKLDLNGWRVDTLLHFLVKKGTFVSPTLGAFEYQAPAKRQKLLIDSVKLSGFNNMKALTAKLKKGGAKIVLGSHSMIEYAETGWAFQRELELFVESGISPSEAIVAATMENARFFRVADRLGSIEVGKIADLILIKGNPVDNIRAARNVMKVMLNGVWVK